MYGCRQSEGAKEKEKREEKKKRQTEQLDCHVNSCADR